MEKKTKKLQLRKETIAVLNGVRMAHVVGGNGVNPCQNGGQFDGEACICMPGFIGQYCEIPMDGGTIVFTLVDCPTDFTCPSKEKDCTLA